MSVPQIFPSVTTLGIISYFGVGVKCFFLTDVSKLLELFLWLFCLEFKYAAVKCIDHICFFVFVITLVFSSIRHVNVSVEEIFGAVFFHQATEDFKALVREITSVIQLIGRCMCHKNINPSAKAYLRKKL